MNNKNYESMDFREKTQSLFDVDLPTTVEENTES